MTPIVFPTISKHPLSPPPSPYMAYPHLRLVSSISSLIGLSFLLISLFFDATLPKIANKDQLRKFYQTRIFLHQGALAGYGLSLVTVVMRAFLQAIHPVVFAFILFSIGVVFYCGTHIIRQSKEVLNLLDSPVRSSLYEI